MAFQGTNNRRPSAVRTLGCLRLAGRCDYKCDENGLKLVHKSINKELIDFIDLLSKQCDFFFILVSYSENWNTNFTDMVYGELF